MEKRLIFVGAHPDDESFGMGGTLAKYALEGAQVAYACATRGEVGSADPEHMEGHATPGDMRWAELMNAAKALGLAEVIHLGYRDSGMPGSPDNQHLEALAAAPEAEVTARVVKVLRAFRPQVVVTFDPIGGYRHPDHIAIHNATVRAFALAGDASYQPELGPTHAPQKLYYNAFDKRWLKFAVKLMPLFGQNPRKFGRNKDIDVTNLVEPDFPIHARIRITGEALTRREAANASHKSQLPSGPRAGGVLSLFFRLLGNDETYMRAYPVVPAGARVRERDLFEGVV